MRCLQDLCHCKNLKNWMFWNSCQTQNNYTLNTTHVLFEWEQALLLPLIAKIPILSFPFPKNKIRRRYRLIVMRLSYSYYMIEFNLATSIIFKPTWQYPMSGYSHAKPLSILRSLGIPVDFSAEKQTFVGNVRSRSFSIWRDVIKWSLEDALKWKITLTALIVNISVMNTAKCPHSIIISMPFIAPDNLAIADLRICSFSHSSCESHPNVRS